MAKTKAAGATKLGRDSRPKYLGVKKFEGQNVKVGEVIVRQRGSKFMPGKNVLKGGDDTLYAKISGQVYFTTKSKKNFDNSRRIVKLVNIKPLEVKKIEDKKSEK
jgi:large subunit ribosomal protein L27